MEAKELCLSLANADSEDEAIKLLKKAGYWDDSSCWKFYGGYENNYSTIGNQQSLPEAALVEKVINSVDAMLTRECKVCNINPESDSAPQTISEAIELFFNIKKGILSSIHPNVRGELAENICLVATGSKSNPCYSIIDKGEGQSPNQIPKTFLSLSDKSNKLRIPFVQGKFNMGGTGVFRFCGRHNMQLIISRRCPEIAKNESHDNTRNKWGFTMVRREDPNEGRRSSVYTYLAPRGTILCFDSSSLPLLPTEYPNDLGKNLEWGSYIKLYEYQMTGYKTIIVFDLYNRLSLLMPNIALPVRLYERRKGYTGHTMETTMSGLSVRLEEDRRKNLEENFPSSSIIVASGEEMNCLIYAFKKGQSETYRKEEGIIFTINGQTHGSISKNFLERKEVGMSYLADSILVIVDCSNISGRSREDLFMNSRDRLCSGALRKEIEDRLEELIKNHIGLRELREKRRREEIQTKLEDSKPLADMLRDLLKKSPGLASLFISGTKLITPFDLRKVGEGKKFVGRQFPTYFRLIGSKEELVKLCPINRRFRIQYETDAENDYFKRDNLPGEFILTVNNKQIKDYVLNLWNGIATLTVGLPPDVNIGQNLEYSSKVFDETTIEPFVSHFKIIVDKETKNGESRPPGPRREPPSDEEGKKREAPSGLDLPQIIEIHQDHWQEHNFDKYSALKVKDAGDEGYDFFVNMDNIYLLTEIKAQNLIDPKLLQARYKYALVLIGLTLLKEDNKDKDKAMKNKEDNKDKEEKQSDEEANIFEEIGNITKALSPILLPMISYLGDLEIINE